MAFQPQVIRELELDLHREKFECFEHEVNELVVEAMKLGIRLGICFPYVEVTRTAGGVYRLMSGVTGIARIDDTYGGHHRAIAHFEERKPLPVRVWTKHRSAKDTRFVPIRNVRKMPVSNWDNSDFTGYDHLESSLKILPFSVRYSFCERYNLLDRVDCSD